MSSIRGKNTKPELAIRKILWSNGVRYRIHNKRILGTPDISIRKKKIAIFIDGCFWHGCEKCYKEPSNNTEFWKNKIQNNKDRRKKVKKTLKSNHWNALEFWEHEINKNPNLVANKIFKLMGNG